MYGHVAITINDKNDIRDFYKGLLGMREIKNFEIPQNISKEIFNIDKSNPIVTLAKDNLVLELFICQDNTKPVYNHIGIYCDNRLRLIEKVKTKGYPVYMISRKNKKDLIFIEDNSGNKFEIAEVR